MGTEVQEREAIANVLAGFTAAPVLWPDTEGDPPSPGNNPANPVSYIAVDVEYDEEEPVTFGPSELVRGHVVTMIWAERNGGDFVVRSHIDTLYPLFKNGDDATAALTFIGIHRRPAVIGGENREWYGRQVDWYFTRSCS